MNLRIEELKTEISDQVLRNRDMALTLARDGRARSLDLAAFLEDIANAYQNLSDEIGKIKGRAEDH